MRFIKVLFLLFLFVFSIMFFSQNSGTLMQELQLILDIPYVTTLHSLPLPFGLILLAAFTAGCLMTIVYFAVDKVRAAAKFRECRNRMSSLEKELNSLRNMPIEEAQPYSEAKEEETV